MDFSSLSMVSISNSSLTSSSSSLDLDVSPSHYYLTKLNAEAPAFIPRSASSPSLTNLAATAAAAKPAAKHRRTPSASVVVPSKTVQLHVYATSPGGTTYHQITTTTHLPVQNNYLYAPQQPVQCNRGLLRSGSGGFLDNATGQDVAAARALNSVSPPPSSDTDQAWKKLSDEACNKIVNQVEFYFSDLNLATTDHLIRVMSKDPEGYVPMSVVASFKKIKALVSSHAQLAKILRNSTKLVVSEDGKKVKRRHRLTETDMEELQSRIVIAENLPQDHCHQNLMKIFSTVGSVKMIRTCQPQASSSGGASSGTRTTKSDSTIYSNKLHAFVEYETIELAEKAVAELKDRNDWRNGLKIRPLIKRTAKSSQTRVSKVGHESEANFKEDDKHQISSEHSESKSSELVGEEEAEKDGVWRANNNRGRGKGQAVGRPQFVVNNNRGSNSNGNPAPLFSINATEQLISAKQQATVPRMPDGTRGFSMGRGKPIAIKTV